MLKLAVGILCGLAATGCGSSKSTTAPSPSTSTFQGSIAGSAGQAGIVTITIQAVAATAQPIQHFAVIERIRAAVSPVVHAAVSTATGSIRPVGGSTTALSGTYDSSSHAVILTGGEFSLTGNVSGNVIGGTVYGTYTSSSGSGGFSALSSTSSAVTVYCGRLGIFPVSMQISANGKVSGQTSNQSCLIDGQRSGNTVTFSCLSIPGTTATGTVESGTIAGTQLISGGGQISWSVSECQ